MCQRFLGLLYLVSLFLISEGCNDKRIIQYKFKDIVVTRIDYDGKTEFKYGDSIGCTDDNLVVAEYYGFNNGMDILMIFKGDSSVELIGYGGGYLKKIGSPKIIISKYSNAEVLSAIADYKKKGYGIIRLSNSMELEKKFPDNVDSKVVVQYK